jgi:hypothetical protein
MNDADAKVEHPPYTTMSNSFATGAVFTPVQEYRIRELIREEVRIMAILLGWGPLK